MRRIKSAPANICEMINRKKENSINTKKEVILINQNKNDKHVQKLYSLQNKKKITSTLSGIISDTFIETNKFIPETDNYYYGTIIEIINNFLTNKFNRNNAETLFLSLFIRFIVGHAYHDILVKVKDTIHFIH